MHMLVFWFFSWKKSKELRLPLHRRSDAEANYTGKTEPASYNAANSFRNLPRSHSAIKTKASSALTVVLQYFAFYPHLKNLSYK